MWSVFSSSRMYTQHLAFVQRPHLPLHHWGMMRSNFLIGELPISIYFRPGSVADCLHILCLDSIINNQPLPLSQSTCKNSWSGHQRLVSYLASILQKGTYKSLSVLWKYWKSTSIIFNLPYGLILKKKKYDRGTSQLCKKSNATYNLDNVDNLQENLQQHAQKTDSFYSAFLAEEPVKSHQIAISIWRLQLKSQVLVWFKDWSLTVLTYWMKLGYSENKLMV